MWKAEKSVRARDYDCAICCERGEIDRRVCFRYNEVAEVEVPEEVEGRYYRKLVEAQELDKDAFLEVLADVVAAVPDVVPVFKTLQQLFPKVCPMGLVYDEVDLARVVGWEAVCAKYHVPPVSGALEEWPNKLVQLFEAVAEAKNDYELARLEERTQST